MSKPVISLQIVSPNPPWLHQSIGFFLLTSCALAVAIVYANLAHPHAWLQDLMNGMPSAGDLGLGRFTIHGVTVPMEYPFRLINVEIPGSFTAWICYIVHQIGQVYILTKARQAKERGELEWTSEQEWNPYAWSMLKLNVFFILVHFLQTRIFYDGLAGTFPEISTLFAGVSPLIMAYIMSLPRRGLFFTWMPESGRSTIIEFSQFVKQYHGYVASFGITLTFWYHPQEATFAHMTGFLHIFLLLWQSSLIYQKAHRQRYWTIILEMWIIVFV